MPNPNITFVENGSYKLQNNTLKVVVTRSIVTIYNLKTEPQKVLCLELSEIDTQALLDVIFNRD